MKVRMSLSPAELARLHALARLALPHVLTGGAVLSAALCIITFALLALGDPRADALGLAAIGLGGLSALVAHNVRSN